MNGIDVAMAACRVRLPEVYGMQYVYIYNYNRVQICTDHHFYYHVLICVGVERWVCFWFCFLFQCPLPF